MCVCPRVPRRLSRGQCLTSRVLTQGACQGRADMAEVQPRHTEKRCQSTGKPWEEPSREKGTVRGRNVQSQNQNKRKDNDLCLLAEKVW